MILRFVFWLRDWCDDYLLRHVPDIECPKCGPGCDNSSNRCGRHGCGRVLSLS